jgi:uncharacterized membrane protein YphA (DoxX/SURF4 family)
VDWNIPLWILQIVMALAFLAFGFTHAFGYERARTNPRTAWMTAVPTNALRTIGLLEIAGAIGLILPALTGIARWLTPVAALLLALLMAFAIVFHFPRREYPNIVFNAILGVLVAVIAYGRLVASPL